MCRIDQRRRLPVMFVLSAVLVGEPLVLPAQMRTREAASFPPQEVAPPPHAASGPELQPTPEQVGDAMLAHQRYQEAIAEYRLAPRDSADALNKIGIAYQLMLDPRDALQCYKKSLRLKPRNARVLNNIATVYDSEKEYRRAERFYRKALKLDPGSALMAKNLGTNLMARHKYAKGWEYYKRALEIDPHIFDERGLSTVENPTSLEQRGAMNYYMAKGCVQAGLTDRAIGYLRLALSEGFTSPKKIAEDSSFARLRGNPAFQQLMAEQRAQ